MICPIKKADMTIINPNKEWIRVCWAAWILAGSPKLVKYVKPAMTVLTKKYIPAAAIA